MSTNNTTNEESRVCRLLELPAELRNRIYRCTLVKPRTLVNATTFSQPGLLRTCQQIRAEALDIYFLENDFALVVDDFDYSLASAFRRQAGEPRKDKMTVIPNMVHTSSSWSNLMKWVTAYIEGEVTGSIARASCKDHAYCIAAAGEVFELAIAIRKLPWEDIEKALVVYKGSVEQQAQGRWGWT